MNTKPPTSFKFGHINYKIQYLHPENELLTKHQDITVDGLSSQSQGLIIVSDNELYTQEYKKLVLMHEIIHIILTAHATTIKNNTEDVIDSLSYGMIQAFSQNPWMKEFFA